MKKKKKQAPHRRIVQLSPADFLVNKPVEAAKLDIKRSVIISESTIIRAPAERCFKFIDKQLEETPHWDPIIKWVDPISIKYLRVGSMSRVTFDFRGMIEEAVAMIRSYRSNRTILWTSTHSSKLQEEWRLESEPHGTVVTVTLGYNPGGWAFGRLIEKTMMKSKVEKVVMEMLKRLKIAVETPSRTS